MNRTQNAERKLNSFHLTEIVVRDPYIFLTKKRALIGAITKPLAIGGPTYITLDLSHTSS